MPKKMTHEEFLEKLKEKNLKAYEELEFLDEYSGNKTKLRVRDKYGILLIKPNDLLMGHLPTIMSAENRTEYFMSQHKDRLDFNKYDYSEVEYKTNGTKIKIFCKAHQEYFMQTPHNHINGAGCYKCGRERIEDSKKRTKDEFVSLAILVHNNKYDYSEVDYVNSKKDVKIFCKLHGYFMQAPNSHLMGSGCPDCGREISSGSRRLTKKEFIDRANKIHDFKYLYDRVEYVNSTTKVEIYCNNHKEYFLQAPTDHLQGKGCRKCALEENGWNRSAWIERGNKLNNKSAFKLYKIRMYNDKESFYKIGITFQKLKQRFRKFPYEYEVVELIESKDGGYIWDLEKELHRKYKEYEYIPSIEFKGMFECFSNIGF